jgi:hypothetical protein
VGFGFRENACRAMPETTRCGDLVDEKTDCTGVQRAPPTALASA